MGRTREITEQHWLVGASAKSARDFARLTGIPKSTIIDKRRYDEDFAERLEALIESNNTSRIAPAERAAFAEENVLPPSPELVGASSEVEPDIEEIRRSAERRFKNKHRRAEQKKHQSIRFSHGPVAIIFAGDQHIGNAGTDVQRIFDEQEIILSTPGAYVWQMGDVVDNFVVGRLIAENMKPSLPVWEQWRLAAYYLRGFDDKLVAFTAGNHDAWTAKMSGVEYAREVVPDGPLYDSDEVRASAKVGNHEFRVWARHKWQGNSIYNPTHGMERAARFDSARYDVYVGAHTHKGAMYREFILDGSRKAAVQLGSYKFHDDFAKTVGFPAHDSSTACGLVLHDDGSFFGCADLKAIRNYMKAVYAR